MGVVSQIKDLDNFSKALPYKSSAMFTVGEGLAPPENSSVQDHPNAAKQTPPPTDSLYVIVEEESIFPNPYLFS